ncbi:hypothetical protein C8T65DRAFT_99570 [Cerioporus squamosus]|nr:hypothetical protein C8T65DRAFT_99570 [Cerioporus squamosus]
MCTLGGHRNPPPPPRTVFHPPDLRGKLMSGSEHSNRFPRPQRYPQCVYIGKRSPSLQVQMGMERQEQRLRYIAAIIRQTCRKHGVDLYVRYCDHDINQLLTIRDEVIKEIPELREYEEGWPVLFYLKVIMHDHGGHTPGNHGKWKRRVLDENRPVGSSSLAQKRRSIFKPSGAPRIAPGLLRDTAHGASLNNTSSEILRTQGTEASRPSATSGVAKDGDVIIISDDEDSVPQSKSGSTAPSSSLLRCSSQATLCSPGPSSSSSSSSDYGAKTPRSIMDMLISGGIPHTDAQHLARLLASMGVVTREYLGTLARMKSRDVWLLELCGQQRISEIQMRILRDILEELVAEQ